MIEEIKPGMRMTWARTFTREEILAFAALSGDKGAHHIVPDAQGRLMAHGLLTASLPTKLGGDLDFIAATMQFDFLRPAYSGETLTCLGVVDEIAPEPRRWRVKFSFLVTNEKGKRVLKGTASGVIYRSKPDA
jgi:acyl dehydratase